MTDTLRLLMPQWQGGNNPAYAFGARLLAWLAPGADTTTVQAEVPVEVENGRELLPENGVVAQSSCGSCVQPQRLLTLISLNA